MNSTINENPKTSSRIDPEAMEFLDDCVSTVEVIRCMLDKGVEHIDGEGVTLKEEVFDRCFPGRDWQVYPIDGEPGWTFTVKTVLYRGFVFDAVKRDKELGNE